MIYIKIIFYLLMQYEIMASRIPDYISLCNLDDPLLYQCVRKNAEAIRPHLAEGIREMNIPSLEPARLPRVDLEISNFRINMTNISVYYASTFDIKTVELNIIENKNATFKMDLFFPILQLQANYDLKGKLLFFQLEAKDYLTTNFTDVNATILVEGQRVIKKKSYFNFTNSVVTLKPKGLVPQLGYVFPGNKELSENIGAVLAEHALELFADFAQVLEEAVRAYVLALLKQVFRTFSLDELFPGSSILNT